MRNSFTRLRFGLVSFEKRNFKKREQGYSAIRLLRASGFYSDLVALNCSTDRDEPDGI